MSIARVFKSGNSQAVRLPKPGGMVRVLDLLVELPADMFQKKRKDPQPQRRRGLKWALYMLDTNI